MSMFTVTASAMPIHFYLYKGDKDYEVNTKNRTADNWLISIYEPTGDSIYNFVAGQTVVGFRIRNTSQTSMSDYVTVSSFVNNKAYPYTTVPGDNQTIRLYCQVDSTSKLPYVSFDGDWSA